MTNTVPLILKKEPVSAVRPVKSRTPDVAVIYATPAGEVAVFDPGRRDGWTTRTFSRYRLRYEVDMGDHRRTVELRNSPLPACGGIYHFHAVMDVGFRVVHPEMIVSRDVDDGLVVIYNYLIDICRPITRQFDIQDATGAEEAINARFRHGETLEEGIHLYRCRARLSGDTGTQTFVKSQDDAARADIVESARHKKAIADANRRNELDRITQVAKLEAQDRERRELADRPLDLPELLRIHLEREPHDTQMVVQLRAEMERAQWDRQEIRDQRARELFEFLASRNLIHAVDLGRFLSQVRTQLPHLLQPLPTASGQPQPLLVSSEWDDPLPMPGAASAGPAALAAVDGPGAAPPPLVQPRHFPDILPVYVVIDLSVAVEGCIAELNAGMNSLYDALIAEPAVAGVVRLSIFGYAENVAVPLARAIVRNETERVCLFARGQAHYAAVFERLLVRIPRDIEQLKAEQPNVRRPQVLFLSGAQPTDKSRWNQAYQRLVDRDQHRYAPDILACGIGEASAETIASIATRQELAFVADDENLARSVERYFSFIARQVVNYGRSVLDGEPGPLICAPEGFRPATDLV